jgi:hypothetical protein
LKIVQIDQSFNKFNKKLIKLSEKSNRRINWDELKGFCDDPIEEKAKEILSIMNLEEKVN